MHFNFYPLLQKRIVKALALGCFMIFTALGANAQYRQSDALTYGGGGNGGPDPNGWGIAVGAGYEGTTGDLRSTYKGGGSYSINILHNFNNFTFNASMGFVSYSPRVDTSFINVDDTQVGYIKYGGYTSIVGFVGCAYNVQVADITNLYFGLNIGTYYNSVDVEASTIEGNYSSNTTTSTEFIAPKLGLNFILSNHFAFGIEGRYNVQFGSKASDTDGYSYSVGNIKTYTVSGLLSYYF